jgi:hypothetical protein
MMHRRSADTVAATLATCDCRTDEDGGTERCFSLLRHAARATFGITRESG